jgi:hypothetical protein
MGRYYWSKRDTTDDYKKFTIAFLKKYGYLDTDVTRKYGSIKWSIWDQETGSMWFWIEKNNEEMRWSVRVLFTQTKRDTWEKKDFDYKVPLLATSCHYGGLRWWFLDPCSETRLKCLVLYWQSNGYFASRNTLNLAYSTQNESKLWRLYGYILWDNHIKASKIAETIKYPYRNGRPTKKMRRYLRLKKNSPSIEEMENFELNLLRKL